MKVLLLAHPAVLRCSLVLKADTRQAPVMRYELPVMTAITLCIASALHCADIPAVGNSKADSPAVVETRDDHGNVVERRFGDTPAELKVFRYTYDGDGHCTSTTDDVGRISQYSRDEQGRVIKVDFLNGPGQPPVKIITLTYNANGAIDTVVVNGVKQVVDGKKFEWVNDRLIVDGYPADAVY